MRALIGKARSDRRIVLASLSLTQIVSWGILYYGFAVFIAPMRRELGWSATQLTGAFSAAIFASALAAMPIGRYIDRHGARGVLLMGSCAAVLLLVAWARVETLTVFYIIWFGLGLTMAAVLYEPAFAVVVAWFAHRRAFALTVLTSVGGLASTVFVPTIAALVGSFGWRTALVFLATVLAAVNIPVYTAIVRSRPCDVEIPADETDSDPLDVRRDAARAPATPSIVLPSHAAWLVAIVFGVSALTTSTTAVHVFPFLLAHGYTAHSAALGVATLGAAQVPARLVFAPISKVLPRFWVAPSIFFLQALGLTCLPFASRRPLFVAVFAVSFGFANGLSTLVRSTLVAERFALSQYGSISGILASCGQLGRAAGPLLAAWLATVIGRYEPVWWLLAALVGAAALAMRLIDHA